MVRPTAIHVPHRTLDSPRPQNIALTRILTRAVPPTPTAVPSAAAPPAPTYSYSAREVAPAALLRAQLRRAHARFRLHHGPTLGALHARAGRAGAAAALARFWGGVAPRWDVMLHGAPAAEVFGAAAAVARLAAGGELGVGVGEEEAGSGERAVLEGFVARTPGLVDLVASRFGEGPGDGAARDGCEWLGAGRAPGVDDGVIFAGVGALSRAAVGTLAVWMEGMARDGVAAYGVRQSPHSARRKRRKRAPVLERQASKSENAPGPASSPRGLPELPAGIPPPIVRAADRSLAEAETRAAKDAPAKSTSSPADAPTTDTDTFMRYMTFGLYNPARQPSGEASQDRTSASKTGPSSKPPDGKASGSKEPHGTENGSNARATPALDTTKGCFLIGLRGNLEDEEVTDDEETDEPEEGVEPGRSANAGGRRILLRTLHLERDRDPQEKPGQQEPDGKKHSSVNQALADVDEASDPSAGTYYDHLQVVVYAVSVLSLGAVSPSLTPPTAPALPLHLPFRPADPLPRLRPLLPRPAPPARPAAAPAPALHQPRRRPRPPARRRLPAHPAPAVPRRRCRRRRPDLRPRLRPRRPHPALLDPAHPRPGWPGARLARLARLLLRPGALEPPRRAGRARADRRDRRRYTRPRHGRGERRRRRRRRRRGGPRARGQDGARLVGGVGAPGTVARGARARGPPLPRGGAGAPGAGRPGGGAARRARGLAGRQPDGHGGHGRGPGRRRRRGGGGRAAGGGRGRGRAAVRRGAPADWAVGASVPAVKALPHSRLVTVRGLVQAGTYPLLSTWFEGPLFDWTIRAADFEQYRLCHSAPLRLSATVMLQQATLSYQCTCFNREILLGRAQSVNGTSFHAAGPP